MAFPYPSSKTYKTLFGTGSGADTRSYSAAFSNPPAVTNADFVTIFNLVNQERNRRGSGSITINPGQFTGLISASDLNTMKTNVEVQGVAPPRQFYTDDANNDQYFTRADAYTGGFTGVLSDRIIFAQNMVDMLGKINSAGAVCVCNCNYCTCNCNYCTCNCNFSCTCQCNYSDERLKTDIEFVGTSNGLNTYTFKYIWDKVTTHFGVMAQEILNTKYSNAVVVAPNGYYMVDYAQLPSLKG